MKLGKQAVTGILTAILAGAVPLVPPQAAGQEQGVEELTRGPVHEAFAASVSFNPEAGIAVDKAPPELIEEVPPEQRPEGENVVWIPGYWGWDEEQSDFIWISGIWRNLPPGRQWVPGYWGDAQGKWQWTSGYWADEEQQEVEYLPAPPKSIESGPNVAAPSKNHVWVSGNWTYRQTRYAWTPGYWEPAQPNWVWIPAHYRWTPRGYVFVGGYWDYDINRRGMIFAPARIHHDVYSRPGWAYTPLVVISLNAFSSHMFVRPTYCHYYFGDYYSPRYRDHGYYAPYIYNSGHRGYDPFYVHNRWKHCDDRDWERRRIDDFHFYRDNEDARPPRTWKEMQAHADAGRKGRRGDEGEIAQPLDRYVKSQGEGRRFQTVSKESRDQIAEQGRQVRKFGKERQHLEKSDLKQPADSQAKPETVKREKLPKSPVFFKPDKDPGGIDAPPKRHGTRESDLVKKSGKDAEPGKDPVIPGTSDKPKKSDGNREDRPDMHKRDSDKKLKPGFEPGKDPVVPDASDKTKKSDEPRPDKRKHDTDKSLINPKRVKEDGNPLPKPTIKPESDHKKLPETKREFEPKREPVKEPKKLVVPETPKPKKQFVPEKPPAENRRQVIPESRKENRQPEAFSPSKKKSNDDDSPGESKKKKDR